MSCTLSDALSIAGSATVDSGALDALDTASVAPMAHPLPGLAQRLRPDVVTETDHHEEYQANAPQVAAGLYLVPKVIE